MYIDKILNYRDINDLKYCIKNCEEVFTLDLGNNQYISNTLLNSIKLNSNGDNGFYFSVGTLNKYDKITIEFECKTYGDNILNVGLYSDKTLMSSKQATIDDNALLLTKVNFLVKSNGNYNIKLSTNSIIEIRNVKIKIRTSKNQEIKVEKGLIIKDNVISIDNSEIYLKSDLDELLEDINARLSYIEENGVGGSSKPVITGNNSYTMTEGDSLTITYSATTETGIIIKHEISNNGGLSYSQIHPTGNYQYIITGLTRGTYQYIIRVTNDSGRSSTLHLNVVVKGSLVSGVTNHFDFTGIEDRVISTNDVVVTDKFSSETLLAKDWVDTDENGFIDGGFTLDGVTGKLYNPLKTDFSVNTTYHVSFKINQVPSESAFITYNNVLNISIDNKSQMYATINTTDGKFNNVYLLETFDINKKYIVTVVNDTSTGVKVYLDNVLISTLELPIRTNSSTTSFGSSNTFAKSAPITIYGIVRYEKVLLEEDIFNNILNI